MLLRCIELTQTIQHTNVQSKWQCGLALDKIDLLDWLADMFKTLLADTRACNASK